jgi:hypothetical protein
MAGGGGANEDVFVPCLRAPYRDRPSSDSFISEPHQPRSQERTPVDWIGIPRL